MIMSFKTKAESPTVVSDQMPDSRQQGCLLKDHDSSTLLMLGSTEFDTNTYHGEYVTNSIFQWNISHSLSLSI